MHKYRSFHSPIYNNSATPPADFTRERQLNNYMSSNKPQTMNLYSATTHNAKNTKPEPQSQKFIFTVYLRCTQHIPIYHSPLFFWLFPPSPLVLLEGPRRQPRWRSSPGHSHRGVRRPPRRGFHRHRRRLRQRFDGRRSLQDRYTARQHGYGLPPSRHVRPHERGRVQRPRPRQLLPPRKQAQQQT